MTCGPLPWVGNLKAGHDSSENPALSPMTLFKYLRGVTPMAKVLCLLYDDPVDGALLQRCRRYRRLGGGGTVQEIDRR